MLVVPGGLRTRRGEGLRRSGVVTAVVLPLLVAGGLPAASAAPPDSTTRLTGELVVVERANSRDSGVTDSHGQHHHGPQQTQEAVLDVDGTMLRLDRAVLQQADAGDLVTVVVDVPDEVVAAAATGALTVTTPEGLEQLPVSAAEVAAADHAPASAGSTVAEATAAVAAAANTQLDTASLQVVQQGQQAPVAQAAVVHPVTVAVVTYRGSSNSSYTDAAVQNLVSTVSGYWSDQTAGAQTFTTASITRYASTIQCSSTSYTAMWNEAASQTGFTSGAGKHLLILFPAAAYSDGCSYGLGTVGSTVTSGGKSYVTSLSWTALAHELGHNMSLQHANTLACLPDVAQDSSTNAYPSTYRTGYASGCGEQEYGDGMDVMASSGTTAGMTSTVALRRLGVLPGSDVVDVTATGTTSYPLTSLGSGAGLRSVAVTDPRNGNRYYFENRQPTGRDTSGWFGDQDVSGDGVSGVAWGVRVVKTSASGGSLLLDATPNADPYASDVNQVVAPGTTWSSVAGGVQVRTTTGSGGAMTLAVSVAASGGTHWAGSAVATTTALGSVPSLRRAQSATLTGTVSASSGTPTGTVALALSGGGSTTATLSGGAFSAAIVPLASGSQTLTATYSPTGSFTASSATQAVSAAAAATTVTVVAPSSGTSGAPATVTGTVAATAGSSVGTPTGTVTVTVGAASATGTLSGGAFSVPVTLAGSGTQAVLASYGGTTGSSAWEAGSASGATSVTASAGGSGGSGGSSGSSGGGGGGGVPPAPTPTPSASPLPAALSAGTAARLSGPGRVETAVTVSAALFPTTARAVVVASSATFADSLAGGRLAAAVGGPLLLTTLGGAPDAVVAEVRRLLPGGGTVYLLGGVASVGTTAAADLSGEGVRVVRVAGDDRYETAVRMAEVTTAATGSTTGPIFLASGTDFPDGLAVAALASHRGGVVLLTAGSTLPAATARYLALHDPNGTRTTAVGGPAAAAYPRAAVRLAGGDRYATAALVAAEFGASGTPPAAVGLASGRTWPDALVGAAAMGHLGGPLLLTDPGRLPAGTGTALAALTGSTGGTAGVVFGGPTSVSDDARRGMQQGL